MYKAQCFFAITISIFSCVNLSACAQIKDFFASSASSASMGSSSASLGSISASSASSDSTKSFSDAIFSSSSTPFTKEDQYINDIIDLTYAYVSFLSIENDYQSFQNGISAIATRNGIISWESNPKTYIAIGMGLKKAKLTGVRYQHFKQLLADNDYAKMKDIQKGCAEN